MLDHAVLARCTPPRQPCLLLSSRLGSSWLILNRHHLDVVSRRITIGLNVISVPLKKGSPPALGVGQTPHNDNDDQQNTTLVPSEEDSISSIPWYADWNLYQCVKDCNGPPPCGGIMETSEKEFDSLKACCEVNFAEFINEHWSLDECLSVGNSSAGMQGGVESGEAPSTPFPTLSPTTQTTKRLSRPGKTRCPTKWG